MAHTYLAVAGAVGVHVTGRQIVGSVPIGHDAGHVDQLFPGPIVECILWTIRREEQQTTEWAQMLGFQSLRHGTFTAPTLLK